MLRRVEKFLGSALPKAEFDETVDKMVGARRFDSSRIRADQVARTGGAPEE